VSKRGPEARIGSEMRGEFQAMRLSPSLLLVFNAEYWARVADNFANENRIGGRRFKSCLDHTSVSRFPDLAENRSKSARVRAIFKRAGTRRMRLSARFAQIAQFLSRLDLPRSQCAPGETPSHVGATEQCVLTTAGGTEAPAREGDFACARIPNPPRKRRSTTAAG
jgi:hypothetical protein